jgi:tetratricopeptide (TPR) repeat protein
MNDSPAPSRLRLVKCLLIIAFIGLYSLAMRQRGLVNYAPEVSAQSKTAATPEQKPERFDKLVREDFFAGMMGDEARLDRGMKYCEGILAKNPKHADALVWHGGGLLARAATTYRKGDTKLGDRLWNQGLKEMNEAVALAPENIGIMVGRSATLVGLAQSGWSSADAESRKLLESALLDYEKVYQKQKPYFGKLDEHSRGELLFGLASGWSILGENEKARRYLDLIVKEVEGTQYQTEAQKWLNGKPKAVIQHDCFGCHAAQY